MDEMRCYICDKIIKEGEVYFSSFAYGNEFCSEECYNQFMEDDLEENTND